MPFEFRALFRRARQAAANQGVIFRYSIALAAVVAATGLRLAFNPVLGVHSPALPFTLAVIVAALFGGRGPGLAATALSVLAADWFFLRPLYSSVIANPAAAWGLALYIVTDTPIALLVGSLREMLLARTRAEEALRRQGQLIDFSQDAIITMDCDRRIVTWNKGAEKLYGWTEREAAGKVLHQLLQTAGDTSPTKMEETLCRTGQWEGELSHITRDGRHLIVDTRQVLVRGDRNLPAGTLEINRDITGAKRAEEELRASEARLAFVLEAANLGAWDLDLTRHTVWRSFHHDVIFGYTGLLPDFTYETFLNHVLPEDREAVDRKVQQAAASGSGLQLECRIRRTDGAVRWIWAQGRSQSDSGGRPQRLSGVVQDITEQKQAQERLRQAQALERIGLLATGVAHDFNNLLTVIMGSADCALIKHPYSEELHQILNSSKQAAHLTGQLLAYAGKGQFITTTFDLTDLVSRSTHLLSASIPERVSLVFNLSRDDLLIKADPRQIEQVLINLVTNAGEAMPSRTGGRIEIATATCDVTPDIIRQRAQSFDAEPGRFVCLEVMDNGTGMDEATLSQVFDPFFSTKFQGRGLGLPAVHGIVRSCKGFIDVSSSRGIGSTFRVFLPAAWTQPKAEITQVCGSS